MVYNRPVNRVNLTCTYCGKEFERVIPPSKKVPEHPYCSVDCRTNQQRYFRLLDIQKRKELRAVQHIEIGAESSI
jgi:hypothetical protein